MEDLVRREKEKEKKNEMMQEAKSARPSFCLTSALLDMYQYEKFRSIIITKIITVISIIAVL